MSNILTSVFRMKEKEFPKIRSLYSFNATVLSNPDFNVEKLAEHAYISRSVFNNKIKSLTGYTPSEFLREIRLKIAAKLLLESDMNISEVAYQTGFNNVKYFRNHFKNLYDITPSEFKEKYGGVEEFRGSKSDI